MGMRANDFGVLLHAQHAQPERELQGEWSGSRSLPCSTNAWFARSCLLNHFGIVHHHWHSDMVNEEDDDVFGIDAIHDTVGSVDQLTKVLALGLWDMPWVGNSRSSRTRSKSP